PALHSFPTRRSSDLVPSTNGVVFGNKSPPVALLYHLISIPDTTKSSSVLFSKSQKDCSSSSTLGASVCCTLTVTLALDELGHPLDRKSTRLNSSHVK